MHIFNVYNVCHIFKYQVPLCCFQTPPRNCWFEICNFIDIRDEVMIDKTLNCKQVP